MERTAQEAGEHQNRPGLRDRRQAEDAAAAAAAAGTRTSAAAAAAAEYRKLGADGRTAATRRAGTRRTDRRRRGARVARADRQVGRAEKTVRPTVADGRRPGAGVVRGYQSASKA